MSPGGAPGRRDARRTGENPARERGAPALELDDEAVDEDVDSTEESEEYWSSSLSESASAPFFCSCFALAASHVLSCMPSATTSAKRSGPISPRAAIQPPRSSIGAFPTLNVPHTTWRTGMPSSAAAGGGAAACGAVGAAGGGGGGAGAGAGGAAVAVDVQLQVLPDELVAVTSFMG